MIKVNSTKILTSGVLSSSKLKRDSAIDFSRGIVIISIIFIHTTFFSGIYYVPYFLRQMSLLLDVPAFFFISGMTFCIKPFSITKSITRIIVIFTLAVVFHDLIFQIAPWKNVFLTMTLHTPKLHYWPVLSYSYWFAPVYVVIIIIAPIMLQIKNPLIPSGILIFYYLIVYFTPQLSVKMNDMSILGVNINYVFFYSSFFLLGYWVYSRFNKIPQVILHISILIIGLLLYFLSYLKGGQLIFDLQKNKFPPQLPYVAASFISLSLVIFFIFISRHLKTPKTIVHIGRYAIFYYVGQGVGGSVILFLQTKGYIGIESWILKLPIMFSINIIISFIYAEFFRYIYYKISSFLPESLLKI